MVIYMIYLDYSATTKVDNDTLNYFNEIVKEYYANPNSKYDISLNVKKEIEKNTKIIANYLNVDEEEIIYTSGASEANNLAIKGVVESRPNSQIITTKLEHSSIITPLGYLQKKGYKVVFVNLKENGEVDFDHLEELLQTDTSLVTIGLVSSELGIIQPINKIGELINNYPNTVFHSDITQGIGKMEIDLTNVDLASISAHKFYAFKGIGALIKKRRVNLIPLIHGGRSITSYRAGTPQTELICSMGYAVSKLSDLHLDHVRNLNENIKTHLSKYDNVFINSPDIAVPHILNISIINKLSDDTQEYFANNKIYLSTKTACSDTGSYSKAVFELTKSIERAESSIRISLSKYTTNEEIDKLLEVFDSYLK